MERAAAVVEEEEEEKGEEEEEEGKEEEAASASSFSRPRPWLVAGGMSRSLLLSLSRMAVFSVLGEREGGREGAEARVGSCFVELEA